MHSRAMLYLIGAGVSIDLTSRGLEYCKEADEIYLDRYTVLVEGAKEKLEKQIGKEVKEAGREFLESKEPLEIAKDKDIAIISIGDPFFATTHISLYVQAKERGVGVKVAHNSSIVNIVGRTGLSPYKLGGTVTIARWLENYKPSSPIERIGNNIKAGLHTLVLADISNGENMGIEEFVRTARAMEEKEGSKVFKRVICVSRAGLDNEKILYVEFDELPSLAIESPYSILVPAELSSYEKENLEKLY
ncbi:MAG: diphthine synthase [Methanobacteriota archaeon]|nr:MAG: diphthine synthase [Euryarchaeota archaeon]